jgi:hypothetical protein
MQLPVLAVSTRAKLRPPDHDLSRPGGRSIAMLSILSQGASKGFIEYGLPCRNGTGHIPQRISHNHCENYPIRQQMIPHTDGIARNFAHRSDS